MAERPTGIPDQSRRRKKLLGLGMHFMGRDGGTYGGPWAMDVSSVCDGRRRVAIRAGTTRWWSSLNVPVATYRHDVTPFSKNASR